MLCLRTLTHYPLLSTGSIQERKFYEHKIVVIVLPINLNMCFGCSKEPSGCFESHNICFG